MPKVSFVILGAPKNNYQYFTGHDKMYTRLILEIND